MREVANSGRASQEDKKGAIIESIIYSAWYIIIPAFQAPDKMLPGEVSERLQIYFDPSSTCYNENSVTVIKLGDSLQNWWWILPLSQCHATSY